MNYLKKSRVVGCCFVGILILQLIFNSNQSVPELILNLGNKLFGVATCIGAATLAVAVIIDFISYRRSRY